jgi:hypothetical protein
MLPSPQIGQHVRLEGYGGRLIVKAVSDDGGIRGGRTTIREPLRLKANDRLPLGPFGGVE